jgi:hypothetical protein
MKHVVLSTDASGQPKIDEVASLDEAVAMVERLRNEDGVDNVRVMREVPIEVKTYYRVVVADDGAEPAAEVVTPPDVAAQFSEDSVMPAPPSAPAPEVAAEDPAPAVADTAPAPDAGDTSALQTDPPADDGFFTPPPVRSHPLDDEVEEPAEDTSERRTSLFGRG